MEPPRESQASALAVAVIGLVALAAAMGVGRFAFTPLLPLMQASTGLSIEHGAWIAGANYLGYLVGAVACTVAPPAPGIAVRLGLAAIAVCTLAMGATTGLLESLVLRFAAGVASAYVLVGVAAWALPALSRQNRPAWTGWVFSGVGIGIVVAGLVGLIAGIERIDPAYAWLALGAACTAVAAATWIPLRAHAAGQAVTTPGEGRLGAHAWRLVFCYASFGFGYIIPATFLPAMARQLIDDPLVFGWVWPAFGVTAAASTAIAAQCFRQVAARKVWAAGQLIMAAGVLAPVLVPGLWPLLVCAVGVGGTISVITMAAMQEARRVAGAGAPKLMAAMTAAFALGQLAGPLVVAFAVSRGAQGVAGASVLAAALLLVAAWTLLRPDAAFAVPDIIDKGSHP